MLVEILKACIFLWEAKKFNPIPDVDKVDLNLITLTS